MKKDFPILKKKSIFSGKAIHVVKWEMKAPDGKTFIRELIQHPGAAVAIPVLPGERFVMVSQHRAAVNGWLLEFPAGTLEPGEKPRVCAHRELIEEAGFRAGKLTNLVDFFPAPGISMEHMYLYLATDLRPAKGTLDADEFLEVKIVPRKALEKKIKQGKIKDGKTIIGFFYYQLLKQAGKLRGLTS